MFSIVSITHISLGKSSKFLGCWFATARVQATSLFKRKLPHFARHDQQRMLVERHQVFGVPVSELNQS